MSGNWGTTSDNEWERMTTFDNEWYNEWQRVLQRVTTNDNEWQRITTSDKEWQLMAMSDSEWEQWYSEWKRHSALQRMAVAIISITKRDTLLLQWMDGCNC